MSPRPLAGSRLRRVLALVPWIAEHPGAALEEIAARFYPGVPQTREMGPHETFYSNAKAKRMLGWQPQHQWR